MGILCQQSRGNPRKRDRGDGPQQDGKLASWMTGRPATLTSHMGTASHQRSGWGRTKQNTKKTKKQTTKKIEEKKKKKSSCGLQPAVHGQLRKAAEKSQPAVSSLNLLRRHLLPAGKPPANLMRRKNPPFLSETPCTTGQGVHAETLRRVSSLVCE